MSPETKPRRRNATRGGVLKWVPFAFILPNILGVLIFTLVPLVSGVLVAFTRWDVVSGIGGIEWIGLGNFIDLARDPLFGGALVRTALMMLVVVPGTVFLGLALANALNKPLPGRAALRAIFFLPYIVNVVAIGTVWLIMLNPQFGIVNQMLRGLGLSAAPGWLTSTDWALPALMLIAVWSGVGYVSVIYLAALQDLPGELYEAAMIDGAGSWTRFWEITWPALMPTTVFLFVTTMISVSQGFGLIAFLTQGGPGTATTTASFYMYQNGFQFYRFGYAAAIGMVMFAGVLIVTLALWRYQRGRGLYT